MSEWIKCSDRLPTPNVMVLGYILGKTNKSTQGPFFILHKNREHHPWEWLDGNTCYSKVTHWMPLPEPPEDESCSQ